MKFGADVNWLVFSCALFTAGCIAPERKQAIEAPSTPQAAGPKGPEVNAFKVVDGACASSGAATAFDFNLVHAAGRTEPADGALSFVWSGTNFTTRFTAPSIRVDLEDPGRNQFYVYLDGHLQPGKLVAEPGRHCYELSRGQSTGPHEITLYRLTEALFGESRVYGFHVDAGGALSAPVPHHVRRIEVIGDSITAAYGVEGENRYCHFTPDTENHAMSYAAIVGERLNAETWTVAWSGKGVFSNRGSTDDVIPMPALWERTLPEREDSRWNFARYQPDAVIINLGTNDFAPENENTSPFADAYLRFLQRVRAVYPKAFIFCAVGPILSDQWPPEKHALTTVRAAVQRAIALVNREGDGRVLLVEHRTASDMEGWGCDWHPNRATQARMAGELEAVIQKAMHW